MVQQQELLLNNKIVFLVLITVAYSACTKKPDIENTSTVKMAGEFWVQTFKNGTLSNDFKKIITYNTSDPNSGKIWVDDVKHTTIPFKAKVDVDYANLAFKPTTGVANEYAAGKTINVVEGKVVPNAGHSKTGVIVDSIYLKLTFSNDASNATYEFKGHGRTGFFEDEY